MQLPPMGAEGGALHCHRHVLQAGKGTRGQNTANVARRLRGGSGGGLTPPSTSSSLLGAWLGTLKPDGSRCVALPFSTRAAQAGASAAGSALGGGQDDPLEALLGQVPTALPGHVTVRLTNTGTMNTHRTSKMLSNSLICVAGL